MYKRQHIFGRWKYLPSILVSCIYIATGVAFRIKLDFHGVGLTPSDLTLASEALQMRELISDDFIWKNVLLGIMVLAVSLLLAHFIKRPPRSAKRRLLEAGGAIIGLAVLILIPIWENHVSDEYHQVERCV